MPPRIIKNTDPAQLVSDRWYLAATDMTEQILRWESLQRKYKLGSANNLDTFTDERGKRHNSEQNIARITSSVIYNTVETMSPRLMGLFNNDGWFSVSPRPRSDTTMKSARAVQDKLRDHIDLNNMNTELRRGAKQAVKIGSAIFYVGWDIQEGIIHTVDGFTKSSDKGFVFNGATLKLWHYRDFYPDPKGRTLDECEYVITESTVPLSVLEERVKLGLYEASAVKKVKEHLVVSQSNDVVTFNRIDYQQSDKHRQDVRIVSYWEDTRFIYVAMPWNARAGAQGITLNIKNQDNPFDHQTKPFVHMRLTPDEDRFWAPGMIEAVRDDQEIMDTLYRMLIEVGKRDIRPQRIIATEDLDVDLKELQGYVPDKIIEAKSMPDRPIGDHIYEFKPEVSGFMNLIVPSIGLMKQEVQEKTGVTATLTGQAGVGTTKTKGGLELLTANALNRGSDMIDTFAEDCVLLLDILLSMSQQFGMPTEDIYGDYILRAFLASGIDKASRRETLERHLPMIAQLGGDVVEVERRILQDAGVPAIDSILPSDENERNANIAKNQEQQQVQSMMQGGGNAQQS